jgi:hypothetical protein
MSARIIQAKRVTKVRAQSAQMQFLSGKLPKKLFLAQPIHRKLTGYPQTFHMRLYYLAVDVAGAPLPT